MATTGRIIKPGYEIDKIFFDKIIDTILDIAVDPEIDEELAPNVLESLVNVYKEFVRTEVSYDPE